MGLEKILSSLRAPGAFLRLSFPVLLTVLMLVAIFGCRHPAAPKTDLAPPSGAELFTSKCSRCHDVRPGLNKSPSAEVRFDTVERVVEESDLDLAREVIERLVKYHVERQRQEASLLEENCWRCHPGRDSGSDQPRTIIRRIQQEGGNDVEDRDVEIIVERHVQAQRSALEEHLSSSYDEVLRSEPDMKRGMTLFLEKCSSCHKPARALTVMKDPEAWERTIKRMQSYGEGAITDLDVKELVDFHVSRQQREIDAFREACTKCHDEERINRRSMSEEQWGETIRRMQRKAPELISDEKVNLLAEYFHRRELTLARIFYGKCRLCHFSSPEAAFLPGSVQQVNGLIALAKEEFGQSLLVSDVNNLLSTHVQRQKRIMRLYEDRCATCHPSSGERGPARQGPEKRTRVEWIAYIAMLQGVELSEEARITISSQIDCHVSRHQAR